MRIPLLTFILCLCCLMAACTNSPVAAPTAETASENEAVYRTMDIDTFAGIIEAPERDYTVVNVHIPYEGEVVNTDLFVTYSDVDALMSALPDKDAPIILYCRSGRMSDIAAHALIEQGYTQVYDVPGGMNAWQESGRELITKES